MNRYAQISSGVVTNVIESASVPGGGWVACGNAGPGYTYDGANFAAQVPPTDPCLWLIDLGPFYDRFSSAKMAVLSSSDATIKAILSDLNIRKWVDLQRADVASAISYVGSIVPSLTSALQAAILTTAVTPEENRALKRLYF